MSLMLTSVFSPHMPVQTLHLLISYDKQAEIVDSEKIIFIKLDQASIKHIITKFVPLNNLKEFKNIAI